MGILNYSQYLIYWSLTTAYEASVDTKHEHLRIKKLGNL